MGAAMTLDADTTDERPFGDNDLFYSRTDGRGVIAAANSVFFRISGYDPAELIGAPHRLIRHSDMPRGVFHLFWARLQAGLPVGAYVKNRAKDGRHYWVYSVTRPVTGGYLSVRMKPGTVLLDAVRELYPLLLRQEAAGMSPADSAAALTGHLRALGYRSYDAFMADSLRRELARHAWAQHDSFVMQHSASLADGLERLGADRALFFEGLEGMRLLPTNMRILSTRLGASAGAIREISACYMTAMQEVLQDLHGGETAGGDRGFALLDTATFDVGAALLQGQCMRQFAAERDRIEGYDRAGEIALFAPLVAAAQDQARANLRELSRVARRIEMDSEDVSRKMFGLEQIRLLGEIESGRGELQESGLRALMAELEGAHRSIRTVLGAINDCSARIRDLAIRSAQAAI